MPPARTSSFTALNLFTLLFAISAIIGVAPAYDRDLTNDALVAILASVGLYFAIAFLARSWLAVRIVSGFVLLAATGLALYFISQFGYQNYAEAAGIIRRVGEITTLPFQLGDQSLRLNAVAVVLEVAVPLGAARVISSQTIGRRLFWAACVVIMLYAIFLTYSRGSWLALGAVLGLAIAAVILSRLPYELAIPIVGVGAVIVIGGLVAVILLGPDRLPFLSSAFATAGSRGVVFQNSLNLGRDTLFTGIGLGDTFPMVYSRYSLLIFVPFLTYAYNLPLAIWLDQGLLGLVAFGGMAVMFYVFVYRVIRFAPTRRMFYGAWLGVTATLLHGLTDAPQYADSRWVISMLFIGMGIAVASGRVALGEVEDASDIHPTSFWRWAKVTGVLVILVAGLFVVFNRQIMAAWYTNLGAIDEMRADLAPEPRSAIGQRGERLLLPGLTAAQRDAYYTSAQSFYEQALALDPDYANANRRLGNLLVNRSQFEAAVPYLEAAFASEPTYPATIKGLGLAYVWVGRTQDAINTFALHDDPASIGDELFTWGYFRRDDLNEPLLAARAWETAEMMAADPNVDIWLLIADTYLTAGATEDARRCYENVLEIAPDNEPAQNSLATLE